MTLIVTSRSVPEPLIISNVVSIHSDGACWWVWCQDVRWPIPLPDVAELQLREP